MRYLHLTIIFLFVVCSSCSKGEKSSLSSEESVNAGIVVKDFIWENYTKSVSSEGFAFAFQEGDRIGIVPHALSGISNTAQMPMRIVSGIGSSKAEFTSGIGWSMITDGRYQYVAYFPYTENYSTSGIEMDFTSQVQSANGSTAHLSAYDFLYSNPAVPTNAFSHSFEMNHLCALAHFNITVPEEFAGLHFKQMTIATEDAVLVKKGICNVGATLENGIPTFSASDYQRTISLKLSNILPDERQLSAYIMMYPAAFDNKSVEVILWAENGKMLKGSIVCASQENGHAYTYNVSVAPSSTPSYLPDKPQDGETLNILLIGHSFGVDATEYLPALLVEAGIENVRIGRFYYPNCFLSRHYDYYINNTAYTYFYAAPGATKYNASNRKLRDVVKETRWDIIVFQQATEVQAGDPAFGPGSTVYSTYQPYLNNMINMLTEETIEYHDMVPFIGWHMFWGYGSGDNYSNMWNKIKVATKQMQAETGIKLLIPTGQAVDLARNAGYTSQIYGESDYGHHCCRGVGRYLGSCTWFETIIKPIYGVSVEGNTLRMLEKITGECDAPDGRRFNPVNDTNAPVLQGFAMQAAANPYGE